ncbi:MAG: HAD hydrolase family protein [Planctomycetes bacterium]|nr:HAD hydrolase family protein [Planctomycetota bacterium]
MRLVCLDVDGVLTDGRIVYGPKGRAQELQSYHVQDGIAIEWLHQHGIAVTWITGRGTRATELRAKELGVSALFTNVKHKRECLELVQRRLSISADETAVMGDDLPDLALLGVCAVFAAPRNAVADVRQRATFVTRASGGAGAVRELVQAILEARGAWSALVARSLR